MSKVVNKDGLDEIFGIGNDQIPESPPEETEKTEIIDNRNASEIVEQESKKLLSKASRLLDEAINLVENSPDAETVASAAAMTNTVQDIISNVNKALVMERRFAMQIELERIKTANKKELIELQASKKPTQITAGDGSTINIQNNTLPFTQESIVKMLRSDPSIIASLPEHAIDIKKEN